MQQKKLKGGVKSKFPETLKRWFKQTATLFPTINPDNQCPINTAIDENGNIEVFVTLTNKQMQDEDEPLSQGYRRRAKRKSNRHSIFCTNRNSFETEHVIRERENLKAFEERLSLRRQSRVYSTEIDESDILHPQTRIRFEWKDIEYSVVVKNFFGKIKSQKQILSAVSGSVHHGNIVAILGSSGAGKSTLLNILAGKVNKGKIRGKYL